MCGWVWVGGGDLESPSRLPSVGSHAVPHLPTPAPLCFKSHRWSRLFVVVVAQISSVTEVSLTTNQPVSAVAHRMGLVGAAPVTAGAPTVTLNPMQVRPCLPGWVGWE